MALISFDNVSYTYNAGTDEEVPAVKNVSFNIEEGDFVALVGHNGSGKSTVAKLMNGLFLPQNGTVTVDGVETAEKKRIFDIRKTVGVVFQNPDNQMIASIIEDDIAFGPENLGLPPAEIRERVDGALRAVGMLDYAQGTPFRLSGGQKQRIAIAGILAIRPRVMVLDESTAMLDPIGRKEVMDVVKSLNKNENMTVVLITHFMEEAAEAGRIIVLNEGQKAMEGSADEIFLRAAELENIGLSVPLPLRVANRLISRGVKLKEGILTKEELVDGILEQVRGLPNSKGNYADND